MCLRRARAPWRWPCRSRRGPCSFSTWWCVLACVLVWCVCWGVEGRGHRTVGGMDSVVKEGPFSSPFSFSVSSFVSSSVSSSILAISSSFSLLFLAPPLFSSVVDRLSHRPTLTLLLLNLPYSLQTIPPKRPRNVHAHMPNTSFSNPQRSSSSFSRCCMWRSWCWPSAHIGQGHRSKLRFSSYCTSGDPSRYACSWGVGRYVVGGGGGRRWGFPA